jgi:hypothetical protein
MKNDSITDSITGIDISGFRKSGIMKHDVEQLCRLKKIQTNNPYLIGLRIAFWDTIMIHKLTDGVCKKIINTKIEYLPKERPLFLRKPFFIEAKHGEALFKNINAIGGYLDGTVLILLSFFTDGRFLIQMEQNSFTGKGIAIKDIEIKNSTGYDLGDEKIDTLSFITILALMLEAEKTPIMIDENTKKNRKQNTHSTQNTTLIERRMYIDAKYQAKKNIPSIPLDKEGKALKNIHVRGFLRNQPYGPKNQLRKLIYIEEFYAHRWVDKGDKIIIIDTKYDAQEELTTP